MAKLPEPHETEPNIYGLIESIRLRPGMYTSDLNLVVIQTILWGYQDALRRNNLIEPYEGRTFINQQFARWLFETREWSTSFGFADAISRNRKDREEAFALFLELVDEFRWSDPTASEQL